MKNFNKLKPIFIIFFFSSIIFGSACIKKEWAGINFWAVGWTTDVPLEFYVDGVRVQPTFPEIEPEHRPGNLFAASEGGIEKVIVDFKITYNNQIFTSIDDGSSVELSPPIEFYANEGSKDAEYQIRPTGNVNDPWDITLENDDDNSCFVGTWKRNISDCNAPGAEMIYKFNSDGSGTYQNVIVEGYNDSCNILCTVIFYFNWTDNGDGTIQFDYYDISNDCGQTPAVPNDESLDAVCNGSTATIGIREFTKS